MDKPAKQDPREYFAAERTFLAWIRTGLGLIDIGFAVSRFSLFFPATQCERIPSSHSRYGPLRLVRGNVGGLRRDCHPQFRPAAFSTHSRIEIRYLGTGRGVEGRRNTETAVGCRWGRHVCLSYSCALAILIEVALG
ncbi:MAG TPA: DUF202 domain-containing protein [Acidobacteriaceae bacterium]